MRRFPSRCSRRRDTSRVAALCFVVLAGAFVLGAATLVPAAARAQTGGESPDITESDPKAAAAKEAELLSNTRQLTFAGRRAGEGYFSRDGSELVFQSEREGDNPFFQIYLLDLETGDVDRVSPGIGKTTCAWIHPRGDKVLFASTHDDKDAVSKQREEIELRASGREKRYSWDYDEHFEIYELDRKTREYRNLTSARGYDAEGSWSPDGALIAFTSNRRAYEGEVTDDERKKFEIDPAYLNDVYLMNADGSGVRRLTSAPGYDGGPFFSPDGKRICWRRFSPDGARAEVWTMNIDGSDKRQLTRLGAMSWAPFYHPSGEYLIFTTNVHGFANFELYLVDAHGRSEPVRVTYTKGFDGLPVFAPDGRRLAWTTNRTTSGQSQIFMADWNDEQARKLLALDAAVDVAHREHGDGGDTLLASRAAGTALEQSNAGFSAKDIQRHVDYLCRDDLAGRLTGTRGEKLATAYVAAYFQGLGLEPAGDHGTWFQSFEFTSGVALGEGNVLADGESRYELGEDWRPLAYSGSGEFEPAPLAFAGYGMVATKSEEGDEYDSYVHLDVKDRWVVAFRYMPEDIPAERRQHLSRASQLRFKATVARDHGARGLIIVTGPNAKAKNQLVPLRLDGILAGSSLPVVSVTDRVVEGWLARSGRSLKELQDKLDTGEQVMGFPMDEVRLSARIEIERVKSTGRNVLGRLRAGEAPAEQTIVVGAHIDHLGKGASGSSLARDEEAEGIHYGADDNASGVAAMLEVAQYLVNQRARGKFAPRRDILFAAWSGEELGLLGSDHFVKSYSGGLSHGAHAPGEPHHGVGGAHEPATTAKPHGESPHHAAGGASPDHTREAPGDLDHARRSASIYPSIAACINMDMVGRLRKSLILQGVGSSSIWKGEIERRNVPVGLPITLQEDSFLPTDARSFYMHGVPVLSAFTGSHSEYHTPRDTPDTLNYDGAASVARLMGLISRSLALRDALPDFIEQEAKQGPTRGVLRAYLGTIPDYAEEVEGVLLSGTRKNGPADKAGVKGGDIIVELAGKKIENIYDYTHAIEALKIGEKVRIVVLRDGERVAMDIEPGSRE